MTDKEQSDAEPVAWRWKWPDSGLWFATENKLYADHVKAHGVAIEPLFAAPPRPDAQSDAEPDEDRPLGFRTNDVPDPYAEGPQSDAEPADYIPIGGAGNGA
jgi:hypothetical protein